jgi:asparagine synthase (glutamine-hydrolysing)
MGGFAMGCIAGIIDFKKNLIHSTDILNRMLYKQIHRGSDELGIHAAQSAVLGSAHMRLCDPVGGTQPMSRNMGQNTYTIVFNGEIFNAGELRHELSQKSYFFLTHSDTEVLLLSYIEWGPSCLDHLNGMFAFAVWEQHSQRLFMARDRMGMKPLFYSIIKNTLVFASEIKALFCNPDITPLVGEQGLLEIFSLAPGRSPGKTPFKHIDELKPGECMIFSRLGIYLHRYWQYECVPHCDSAEETAEKLKFLIRESVKRQLAADAPVCTFLSGGFDSSVVSALASGYLVNKNEHLNTYSIQFPENEKYFHENLFQPNSDSDYIKTMTEYLRSDHTVFTAGIDEMTEALCDAALARDMPGMGDVDSSFLLLCREMGKNFSVALSGEGADEIFGGYPWYHNNDLLYLETFPWAQSLSLRRNLLNRALEKLPIETYAHERYMETVNETPVLSEESKETQLRRRMFYINIKWFLSNLLERQDRLGLAGGLEIRTPFCDAQLCQYAWNIPWDIMNHGGMEKGIVRLAMKGLLPAAILARKKSPYPKTHHPEYLKKVTALLEKTILDKHSPILQLIDKEHVKNLLSQPDKIITPWYGQLMTAPQLFAFLIQADCWLKAYKISIDI